MTYRWHYIFSKVEDFVMRQDNVRVESLLVHSHRTRPQVAEQYMNNNKIENKNKTQDRTDKSAVANLLENNVANLGKNNEDRSTTDRNLGGELELERTLKNLHSQITTQEGQILTALRNLDELHGLSSDSFKDKICSTKKKFHEHTTIKCYHEESLHPCTKCEECFQTAKLLQKHIEKAHVIVKPKPSYNCKICGNTFGGHAQLSAHKKLHEKRPFQCDQCEKAYPRRVDLDIHMRSHTGELPFKCHLCDKGFAIKVRLTYHLQKHEGVTHNCPHCPAVYDNRNKLKAHLFKHTGMPYKCEICPNVGFHRRIRFANHMKRLHHQDLSEEELAQIFAKNTGKIVHFKNPVS